MSGPVTSIPPRGGSNKGVASYEINCPGNSFVNAFFITNDSSVPLDGDGQQDDKLITSLWPLFCSSTKGGRPEGLNGTASLRSLPKSDKAFNANNIGYSGMVLTHGDLVYSVSLLDATDSPAFKPIKYGSSRNGSISTVACPAGQVITGIYGRATATHMVTLGLRCRRKRV